MIVMASSALAACGNRAAAGLFRGAGAMLCCGMPCKRRKSARRWGRRPCRTSLLAAALLLAGVVPATAQDAPVAALSGWERAAYKTLTFQAVANLADAVLFATVFGAGAGVGAAFLVANTTTAAALYYPYELAWDEFGPAPAATTPQTVTAKAVGYQTLTAGRNLALSYAFSGALLPSAGFVVIAFAVDSVVYIANDVAWDAFRPRPAP